MHFGNSADDFGGSAVRRLVGHDSAAAMSKLVALLLNSMQIVHNWSEKGVYRHSGGRAPHHILHSYPLHSIAEDSSCYPRLIN